MRTLRVSARCRAVVSIFASSILIGTADAKNLSITLAPVAPAWTQAQLQDMQGDLMLWVPRLALRCASGDEDPIAHIRCRANDGRTPRGLLAGWVWTLSAYRYPPGERELIYQAALSAGYTHVAVQAHCDGGTGYHGLYPETCDGYGEKVNTVLRELAGHHLIGICAGVAPGALIAPGLDPSLCSVAMTDWDNSNQADCRINAIAAAFPDAPLYYELPAGETFPKPDRCSTVPPTATNGSAWLRSVRQRHPHFAGVLYEVNQPNGLDKNVAELTKNHAFWRDVPEVLFETDTYWKFWDALDVNAARAHNDAIRARLPYLAGFMSGGTTHAPRVKP